MVSDYTKIKDDNINGTAETLNKIGEFLARVLYNDQTHFIDEIIQNTEDALSRRHQNDPDSELPKSLTFRLYNDRLEVSHFGKPFDEPDVRGICNILEGTKQNDEKGRFVSATQAKLARSKDFRQLILENQLQQLYGSTYTWVSDEITQGKTPEIYRYLTEELKIQEVEPEDFGRKFTENFINIQSDEWIACFYAFLIKQEALWRSDGILRNKPFIRLQNNKHVAPFGQDGLPNAYIPLSSGEETEFPIVKINILQNKFFGKDVKYFLQVLGFSEPDIFAEVVEKTIPKYKQKNIDIHDKIQHQKNIDKIIQALKFTALSSATQEKRKYLINQLKETPFIRSLNITTGKIEYRYPGNKTGEIIYFRSSNLEIYFKGNPNVWFLDESFPEKEQFEILGVSEKVKVFCKKSDSKGNIIISNKARNYQRGLNGFDPDCEIDGLEFALKTNPSYGKALFVWNDLLLPNYQHINGEVEKSTNQKFTNSQPLCTQYSKMGIIACKYQWLPNKNNVFFKPCELSIDDLNDDFLKNSKLANTLKLKPTETSQKIAKLLSKQFKKNIKLEDLEFMISNLDKLPQFKKIIDDLNRKSQQSNLEEYELDFEPNQNNTEFDYVTAFQAAFNQPGEKEFKSLDNDILLIPIPNPKARGDKIINEIRDAQKEEPLKVERFKKIPTTRWESKNTETIRGFLKQLYDGQCQICEVTFPKQDGYPYFEGLYIVSYTNARWIDRPGNVLCLCPNCCAKFKHGSVEVEEDILQQIRRFRPYNDGGTVEYEVHIKLCHKSTKIRFNERHILEMQKLLEFASQDKHS
ncbi:hypothetical protein NIES4072_64130 [Nostoc commune NIES-4072]|uniref:HNH nuclease domain-containing protein n=1 Tax=Nostoc commune NIES-4072 TaxID=2005467 RepID=A0A2R5G3R8_NOSCO|nr:hypothetical protein [Nostoc commune]BBD70033.1 hypothetical protein NIES4070_64440 [Nostoc commune HK-02]GBG22701.1 hypothetical protein NIES4072_64130 [Nostoc commune NIES-4072]